MKTKVKEFIKSEHFDYFLFGFGSATFALGVAFGSGIFLIIGALQVILALFSLFAQEVNK